jgi:hypothetical protein
MYFQFLTPFLSTSHSTFSLIFNVEMQTQSDYWKTRPNSPSGCSVSRKCNIPFRASSLPLFARSRIRSPPPSTPPKKSRTIFTPRSTPLTPTPKREITPVPQVQLLTPPPTPIPFSTFSDPPTTPGLTSSSQSSAITPRSTRTRLITPITPTHIRYDERGLVRGDSDYGWSPVTAVQYDPWSNYGGTEDQEVLLQKMQSPISKTQYLPWYDLPVQTRQVEEVVLDIPRPRPKMLHHVSSDGGPIAALKRYISATKDEDLGGMSLFLHCPKKRVPLHSIERIRKERKIALEWNQIFRVSSESSSSLMG